MQGEPFPAAHCCHDSCHRHGTLLSPLPQPQTSPSLRTAAAAAGCETALGKAAILAQGGTLQDRVHPGLETGPWPA